MPVLSIIIPVYKVEPYVGACLNSILVALEQVEADESFEVICVDDGSPDCSGEILESYRARFAAAVNADRVVYTVIHQKNAGVSVARNVGLAAATGEWAWFIDSDDSIAPTSLSYLARELRERPVDLFRFEEQAVPSQAAPFPSVEQPVEVSDLAKVEVVRDLARRGSFDFTIWMACFRRSVIAKLRFREDMQQGEDTLFSMEALVRASTFAATRTVLYNYVQRPGSCMRTPSLKKVRSALESLLGQVTAVRGWVHGAVVLPIVFPMTGLQDLLLGILKKLRKYPSRESRPHLSRYCEAGVQIFEGSPHRQLLFRTHCPPLIFLYLSVSFWTRVTLLKLRFVRQLRDWVRGRRK